VSSLPFSREEGGKLDAIACSDLCEDVADVPLDRLAREEKGLRYLGVGGSSGDERRNLLLALAQGRATAGTAAPPRADT